MSSEQRFYLSFLLFSELPISSSISRPLDLIKLSSLLMFFFPPWKSVETFMMVKCKLSNVLPFKVHGFSIVKKECTRCDVVLRGSDISSPVCVRIDRKLVTKPSYFFVPFYLAMQIKSKETRGPSTFFDTFQF